jgi:hypothetical protein
MRIEDAENGSVRIDCLACNFYLPFYPDTITRKSTKNLFQRLRNIVPDVELAIVRPNFPRRHSSKYLAYSVGLLRYGRLRA